METKNTQLEIDFGKPVGSHPANEKKTQKKKYHSSAIFAAGKWHNTVGYIKPYHTGLNL